MTAADREVTPAQMIVRDWMKHLGYEPEQIAYGESERHHGLCDVENESWMCIDEDGDSRHPLHDEMDGIAALVMFVLEHAATDAAGYRRAIDRLRDDERYRNWWSQLPADHPEARYWELSRTQLADYLEAVAQDASSTQPHEPQSADRVDIPAVPTVETPEAVRGAEPPDLMAALRASLEQAKADRAEVRDV